MEEDIVKCFLGGEGMTKISKRLRKSLGYVKYVISQQLSSKEIIKIIQERRRPKLKPEPEETDPIGWNAFMEAHKHKRKRL